MYFSLYLSMTYLTTLTTLCILSGIPEEMRWPSLVHTLRMLGWWIVFLLLSFLVANSHRVLGTESKERSWRSSVYKSESPLVYMVCTCSFVHPGAFQVTQCEYWLISQILQHFFLRPWAWPKHIILKLRLDPPEKFSQPDSRSSGPDSFLSLQSAAQDKHGQSGPPRLVKEGFSPVLVGGTLLQAQLSFFFPVSPLRLASSSTELTKNALWKEIVGWNFTMLVFHNACI